MKNLFKISILFIILFVISCSGGDDDTIVEEIIVPVEPVDPPVVTSQFTKKVLVEQYTGTWCGWCPRAYYGLELLEAQTDETITVAVHKGSSDPYNYTEDDFGSLDNGPYPSVHLNRSSDWTFPEPENVSQIISLTNEVPVLGLSINSTLSGNNLAVDVKTTFEKDLTSVKQVVYLVEDNLIYNQNNYTSYYNGVSIIENFEHDNVLRKALTSVFGDDIPNPESKKDSEYEANYSISIPSQVENVNNLKIVAFILDSSGKVLNAQSAEINQFKDYD